MLFQKLINVSIEVFIHFIIKHFRIIALGLPLGCAMLSVALDAAHPCGIFLEIGKICEIFLYQKEICFI